MSALRNNYGSISRTRDFFIRSATLDGSVEGDANAAIDGSITPVRFYVTPAVNQDMEVSEAAIEISDAGNPGFDDYGNLSGPLINGVQLFIERDGVQLILPNALKSNRELIKLGPLAQRQEFSGNSFVTTYTFQVKQITTRGIFLRGGTADKFGIIVNDNLTTLAEHSFSAKGSILPNF